MKLTIRQGKMIIVSWIIFLVGFYLFIGYLGSIQLYQNKMESLKRHQDRTDPHRTEEGKTQVDLETLKEYNTDNYNKVYTGIYVDRIVKISTKETSWTVDFYIWFKWEGNDIDPGKTFQVIDGEFLSKTKAGEFINNNNHYVLYRVISRITKFFNIVRYPLDNHMLVIRIEDRDHNWNVLRYVPDERSAEYSSRVNVPGYQLKEAELVSKPHAYKTRRGDPRLPVDHQAIYSQIVYGVKMERPDWGLYFKMFQGLFASVAIAIVAFSFGPMSSDRVSLGIGAFFASVASSYINLHELPGVGLVTMTDIANGMGMITILLTLMGSIISARIVKDPSQYAIAVKLDHASLIVFLLGYISTNIAIALSASV